MIEETNEHSPCPACGSRDIVAVVYGLPSPELHRQNQEGQILLAGCLVPPVPDAWACRSCERRWPDPLPPGWRA